MAIGRWRSGYDWFLTIQSPTIFGLQGEILYLLLLWFPFPSFFILKLVGIAIALSLVALVLGYDYRQLWRRLKRWHIGRKRVIYSKQLNYRRLRIGV